MEIKKLVKKVGELLQRYRYAAAIVLLGLVLMALPTGTEKKQTEPEETTLAEEEPTLEQKLEAILEKMDGVGRVQVLLTQSAGEEVCYQTDEDTNSGGDSQSQRSDTVLISDSSRGQQGLIRQVNPPVYLGAVVVCQGADSAQVRYQVVEAVSSATGLATNQISVQKMK